MIFRVYPYRFTFRASNNLQFPPVAANTIRGALGTVLNKGGLDEGSFRPRSSSGPSGFTDPPRPYVIRASALDARFIHTGEQFSFDVHIFERTGSILKAFTEAFQLFNEEGITPRRTPVKLQSITVLDRRGQPDKIIWRSEDRQLHHADPVAIGLLLSEASEQSLSTITVEFVTPTELKHRSEIETEPRFPILFSRIRDRISTLSLFYDEALDAEYLAKLTRLAGSVGLVQCSLEWKPAERRSSRTGQRHPLGGFAGTAVYRGPIETFRPWLEAAYWTGAGRQTVWGKGVIRLLETNPTR